MCTPSGKHSVGCNYGSALDSLSVCNLAPDDPCLLQFLWECLNILPMDSLRSEEMKNERRFLFCSFFSRWTDWYTSGCLSDQSKIYYYRAERKSGSTMVSHFCCARGRLFGKKWKPFFENCPGYPNGTVLHITEKRRVAQLAVICYHSARTVQEWDGYAFDEVTFQKLGDEYEVGLTRKYRSFQNTATTYRLKLNCLDPENTPFPSGYSEWLMDVGMNHLIMMEPIWRRITWGRKTCR